jgi:hypothetical protein
VIRTAEAAVKPIRSTIPARLDRLKWSPFHTNAEGKSLEDVNGPLTATDQPAPETFAIPSPA